MSRLIVPMLAAMVLPAFFAATSHAEDVKAYRFVYPPSLSAQPAEEGLAGPGGARYLRGTVGFSFVGTGPEASDLDVVVLEDPVACGPPVPSTLLGDFEVAWPSACIFPAESVLLRFSTSKGPLSIQNAYWVGDLGDTIAPAFTAQVQPAPGAEKWALAALMALLAFAGIVSARRSAVRA